MTIDRGSGIALWRQIDDTLSRDIADGVFLPGAALPPESALAERFGVNRHTVRQAVAALAERGLVRIAQGRGTFVQENVLDYEIGPRTRFSAFVSRLNPASAERRLLRALQIPAPAPIAEALQIARGATLILLDALGEIDGRPISLAAHHFPADRFPDFIERYRQTGSISQALQDYGIDDYTRRTTRITSRLPEAGEAAHLKQAKNQPVLVAEAINIDSDAVPIEYGVTLFPSARVQIVVQP